MSCKKKKNEIATPAHKTTKNMGVCQFNINPVDKR